MVFWVAWYLPAFFYKIRFFLTTFQMKRTPRIFAELSKRTDWVTVFDKLHRHELDPKSLMCTVLLLVRLHFFTGFYDRCRFLDTRTVSMSAEFRSFQLSMCTGAPESDNKFSFFWFSLGWCWKTPNIREREEYCFVFIFELVHAFGQFPTISAGTSLLS